MSHLRKQQVLLALSLSSTAIGAPLPPEAVHQPWYQPAALVDTTRVSLATKIAVVTPKLYDLKGERKQIGLKLPPADYGYKDEGSYRLNKLQLRAPLLLGSVLGVAASMPQDFLRAQIVSGEERRYLRYGAGNQRPELYTGLALPLPGSLSVAAGMYHTLKTSGQIQVAVSEDVRSRALIDVKPSSVPYFGIRWQPINSEHRLSFSAFYQKASDSSASFDTAFLVTTDDISLPIDAAAQVFLFFEPEILRGSTSYGFGRTGVTFSYERVKWSAYKPPLLDVEADVARSPTPQALRLKDSQSQRLLLAHSIPLSLNSRAIFKTSYGYQSSAMPSAPATLMVVDLPERSWQWGADLEITELAASGMTSAQLGVSVTRSELEDRSIATADGAEMVRAGGHAYAYSFAFDLQL